MWYSGSLCDLLAERYAKADSDAADATVDARVNPRSDSTQEDTINQCGAGDGRRLGTDAVVRPPVVLETRLRASAISKTQVWQFCIAVVHARCHSNVNATDENARLQLIVPMPNTLQLPCACYWR